MSGLLFGSERTLEPADDEVMAFGHIAVYERPPEMPVEEFVKAPPEQLPPPAAEADNVLTNGFYSAIFNVIGAVTSAAGPVTAAYLAVSGAVGGGGIGSPSVSVNRNDTSLNGSESHRIANSGAVVGAGDPTTLTLNFFSPAGDGNYTITEVGLCTSAGLNSGGLLSHAAFGFVHDGSRDVRFDYTLTRSLT